jgi:hypothetical protein
MIEPFIIGIFILKRLNLNQNNIGCRFMAFEIFYDVWDLIRHIDMRVWNKSSTHERFAIKENHIL